MKKTKAQKEEKQIKIMQFKHNVNKKNKKDKSLNKLIAYSEIWLILRFNENTCNIIIPEELLDYWVREDMF